MSEDHVVKLPFRPLAAASLLLASRLAEAGPCVGCGSAYPPLGWWNDRPLDARGIDDHAPRVDVDGSGAASRVAIAFERRNGGEADIWLATSDDGGCNWDLRAVTSGADDDRRPDVAVSLARNAIALVFVRNGAVVSTTSWNGGLDFETPVPVDAAAPIATAARPRLAAIAIGSDLHQHVAWTEGGRLRHARRISPGAWQGGAPLSDRLTGWTSWDEADIAADTRSRDALTESGVMILATALRSPSTMREVYALRSNDTGARFFGDPQAAGTENVPAQVSDVASSSSLSASQPQLDVSDDGTGEFYAWEAATWSDFGAPQPAWRADARAEEGTGPSTIAPWNGAAPDDVQLAPRAVASALAVIPNPLLRPPAPETHLFGQELTGDLSAWRGALEVGFPAWLQETCPSYPLTGLHPLRTTGSVSFGAVSADEDLSHVFLAWEDTREGVYGIWWKRNDTKATAPQDLLVEPADCGTGGGLLVSWTLPPGACDLERMRIDYGLASGVYDGSVAVAPVSPAVITGLTEGMTYYVRATLVDEACNASTAGEVTGYTANCSRPQCPFPVGWSLFLTKQPTDTDITLSWDPPLVDVRHDAATSYDVYLSTSRPSGGFVLHANVVPPTLVDRGAAQPGTERLRCYLIVARNSCGSSGDEPPP